MKSSEEVLALVPHVRHKKVDGSLYVLANRISWAPEKSQNFAVTYSYSDVKSQKISPEGKVKIQLQIVLNSGETSNFHFNSPDGLEKQLKDRARVKDLLQQLLPKYKQQITSQLEEKNQLLQKNPELFSLYKELVVTQIVSPEDFWETYAKQFMALTSNTNSATNNLAMSNNRGTTTQKRENNTDDALNSDDIGISASYLFDLTPISDGANGIKYNLTSDIIDSIFKIYPSVKQKFDEHVPHAVSELEFWTRFFQSHYFNRDKHITKQTANAKDYFFAECLKADQRQLNEQIDNFEPNPLLDLENMDDETNYNEPVFDLYADIDPQALTLIQRVNQHSILLSQATGSRTAKKSKFTHDRGDVNGNTNNLELAQKLVKEKIDIEYKDLKGSDNQVIPDDHLNDNTTNDTLGFLSELYNEVTNETSMDTSYIHTLPPSELTQMRAHSKSVVQKALEFVTEESTLNINDLSNGSHHVLSYYSIGSPYFNTLFNPTIKDMLGTLSPSLINDIKQAYTALNELLKYFYACFPVTTPEIEIKLEKLKDSLGTFYAKRIKNGLDVQIKQERESLGLAHIPILDHMTLMVKSALEKYHGWIKRKAAMQLNN